MSSVLTDLEAALEAVDAARKTLALPLPISEAVYLEREEALYSALGTYHKLLTDDNIAALIAVARAAEAAAPFIGGWVGHVEASEMLDAALAPLVKEADCPTCHGHGGGGGFDRNGSHTEGRYCEYPCPTCGKEADDE